MVCMIGSQEATTFSIFCCAVAAPAAQQRTSAAHHTHALFMTLLLSPSLLITRYPSPITHHASRRSLACPVHQQPLDPQEDQVDAIAHDAARDDRGVHLLQ